MASKPSHPPSLRRAGAALALALIASTISGCSSVDFHRETDTSGSFHVEATSCRFLVFFEAPFDPRIKAMELARDTWADNMNVHKTYSWPNWGFFTFLNGLIIGFRGTIVEGEYGIPPNTPRARAAYDEAAKKMEKVRNIDGSAITPTEGAILP
jgi:hypothetical protein